MDGKLKNIKKTIDETLFTDEFYEKILVSKINSGIQNVQKRKKIKWVNIGNRLLSFSVLSVIMLGLIIYVSNETGITNSTQKDKKSIEQKVENKLASKYKFEIQEATVHVVLMDKKNIKTSNDDINVIQYEILFKDVGVKKYENPVGSNNLLRSLYIDVFAKNKLVQLMAPKYPSAFEGHQINTNMRTFNGEFKLIDREKGIYKFTQQYVIKSGVDPKKALEDAKDAFAFIQIGNRVIKKIDLKTLKSYSLNITYPREWYDMEYKFSKLSGLNMKMKQSEVIKTLGREYTKVTKMNYEIKTIKVAERTYKDYKIPTNKELFWRYDLQNGNNDYHFDQDTYKIDLEGLRNRDLKQQIFISWNKDKTIKNVIFLYRDEKDGLIHQLELSSQGGGTEVSFK
jgi:hypothetical protein